MNDYQKNNNLSNHFIGLLVFILIIAGNFTGELFPCRIQNLLSNNMFMKHLLGYLTLLFFSLLTLGKEYYKGNVFYLFLVSFFIYFYFLILNKTIHVIWITVFLLIVLIYIKHLFQSNNKKTELDPDKIEKNKKREKVFNYVIFIIIITLTLVGFLIYMGEKKYEYKGDFNYISFIFGKSKCLGKTKNKSIIHSIKYILK